MMIGMGLGMVDRDIEVGKEYKVGTFTLNGVTYDRYVKIVDCGAGPNNETKPTPHGITGIVGVLGLSGIGKATNTDVYNPIPLVTTTGIGDLIRLFVNSTNISLRSSQDWSTLNILVTIEYYK